MNTAYNKTLKTTILVNGAGMTLYLYTADHKGVFRLRKGPELHPDLVRAQAGRLTAGAGVKASLLGTTTNGKQVTYNGHPLYTFHGCPRGCGLPDKKPGQVNGQGFYNTWYVVSPKGNAIES